MTDTDRKLWLDRLSHAHDVFREHGISDEQTAMRANVFKMFDAYRGKQWEYGWGGLDSSSLATVNTIFSTVNTMLAQLSARSPRATVTPRNEESVESARVVEALLNYYIGEMRMRREANAALRDAMFMPYGVIRHGYVPRNEYYDAEGNLIEVYNPAKPDLPYVRQIPFWDVRIDPLARTLHGDDDATWCAFRSIMPIDTVRKHPGFKVPRDLRPTMTLKGRRIPPEMRSDQSPDWGDLVEIWTFYDKVERKWFSLTDGSEKPLRDPDDWPIPWEGLPLDLLGFNEQTDDPFPVPYIDQVFPLQIERNKIRTMMGELVKRMRRIIAFDQTRLLRKEDQQKLLDPDLVEFFGVDGPPAQIFETFQAGGFSQDLLAYDRLIVEDIRELIGQSRMDRAQRINVESATEAANVQMGSDTARSRNQVVFEEFMGGVVSNFAKGLQATLTGEVVIPIVGENDARVLATKPGVPFLRATPDQIRGEFSFAIEVGSTLPESKQQRLQEAVGWLAVAERFPNVANLPQALSDVALASGKDPKKALLTNQEIAQMNQNQAMQGMPPGTPQESGTLDPRAFMGNGSGMAQ